jgi:short-subunit dehydrogenase
MLHAMRATLDGTVALVTGASSGIGAELARQLAPRARVLVVVARRKERLDALRAELLAAHPALRVETRACDVTDHAALDALVAEIDREHGGADVLINSAGLGDFGVYDLVAWEKTARMIAVNVTALAYLTRRVVPGMVARRRGWVLNVSSGFGLQFLPGFAAYSATKHFVTAFTECLRLEVRGAGVVVTQVCPGPVATEFEELTADFDAPRLPRFVQISAQRCARVALRALAARRALVVPGFMFKVILALGALTPRAVRRLVFRPAASQIRRLHEGARARTAAPARDAARS